MTEKTPNTSQPGQSADSGKNKAADPNAPGSAPSAASVPSRPGQSKPGPSKPGQSTPEQRKPDQNKPDQNKPAQNKSARNRQDQNKPGSNAPQQDQTAGKPGQPPSKSAAPVPSAPTRANDKDVAKAPAERGAGRSQALPLVLIFVLAIALAGGLWYQHDTGRKALEKLESQASASAQQAQDAKQQAQQALDALDQQKAQLARMMADQRASRAELDNLGEAFQMITDRGSDLVLLNDIDHLVTIAQQQLQLSGNVSNAIISLETAQAQLARANRPALASLQQTINGDLDRLRAATTVDIALSSRRLDELAGLLAQAPLLVPDDAAPASFKEPKDDTQAENSASQERIPMSGDGGDHDDVWWKEALNRSRAWTGATLASLRQELRGFVSVRRVDDATALLVSPDQATRFRENLRLRIMTAQLALMMGQSQIWETETAALVRAVESRYDARSPLSRQALKIARDLADTPIDLALPEVTNSIKALEALREQSARAATAQPSGGDDSLDDDAGQNTRETPTSAQG